MQPWIGEEERLAVDEYLRSGGWLTEFRRTEEFASRVAQFVGSRHAFITANGTVSLFAALAALGVGSADEVIVPDFTMIASANAVLLAGATPVLVDVDPRNFCLDLDLAEHAITPRTKAIMVVSLNGRAPDMDRAAALAARHNLALVEDAAQSLGARWHGKALGTFGVIGSFSFSAPKIITTGQGGALVTDDDGLAEAIRGIRDFGRRRTGVDLHDRLGFNFKFTDLQAVVGIEQMKKLDWRVQRKKEMYNLYRELLRGVEQVCFPPTDTGEVPPWFIDVLVPEPAALQRHLGERQIGTRPFYPPVHTQAPYRLPDSFPGAEQVSAHGLWLPSSSCLSDDEIAQVCQAIRSFFL